MTRRELLKWSAGMTAGSLLPFSSLQAKDQTQRILRVGLQAGESWQPLLGPNQPTTKLWLYNNTLSGPLLRGRQGDLLEVSFRNQLPVPTTVHWHGIRNLNAMDGVAGLTQEPIPPGGSFRYTVPLQDAGTYWYHAHSMTWEQVARGLYGALIVEGSDEVTADVEKVWILDDWRLDDQGQIDERSLGNLHDWSHAGRLGNRRTVNGQTQPQVSVSGGSRLLLRLINAANARIFQLRLQGAQGTIFSLDGFPCEPQLLGEEPVPLGPAQRVDLLVDVGVDPVRLEDLSSRSPWTLGTFLPQGTQVSFPRPALQLAEPQFPSQAQRQQARSIPVHMQGGAMGNLREVRYQNQTLSLREAVQEHQKVWAFNGEIFAHHHRLAELGLGEWVALDVWNDTSWAHAMHLHGHHFWIERQGELLPQKRDTHLMAPGEQARLLFLADNPGLWLFHCHMLEHHAAGMGAVLLVG